MPELQRASSRCSNLVYLQNFSVDPRPYALLHFLSHQRLFLLRVFYSPFLPDVRTATCPGDRHETYFLLCLPHFLGDLLQLQISSSFMTFKTTYKIDKFISPGNSSLIYSKYLYPNAYLTCPLEWLINTSNLRPKTKLLMFPPKLHSCPSLKQLPALQVKQFGVPMPLYLSPSIKSISYIYKDFYSLQNIFKDNCFIWASNFCT